ncbi:hypothetical protein GCM10029963_66360 [Micromonospora andamanensis]
MGSAGAGAEGSAAGPNQLCGPSEAGRAGAGVDGSGAGGMYRVGWRAVGVLGTPGPPPGRSAWAAGGGPSGAWSSTAGSNVRSDGMVTGGRLGGAETGGRMGGAETGRAGAG